MHHIPSYYIRWFDIGIYDISYTNRYIHLPYMQNVYYAIISSTYVQFFPQNIAYSITRLSLYLRFRCYKILKVMYTTTGTVQIIERKLIVSLYRLLRLTYSCSCPIILDIACCVEYTDVNTKHVYVHATTHRSLKAYCAILVRRSKFRYQASPRVSPRESTQRRKV